MSKEQIEEMARTMCGACQFADSKCSTVKGCVVEGFAVHLYAAGYRKQSEGEWEQQLRPYEDEIMCSVCGANFNVIANCTEKFDYCLHKDAD